MAEFAAAADAAQDLGLRVYLGPAYRTGNPFVTEAGGIELFFDEQRGLAGLDDAGARSASLLPGWTVGHVLTHLARNADGMLHLVDWAASVLAVNGCLLPARRRCWARARR